MVSMSVAFEYKQLFVVFLYTCKSCADSLTHLVYSVKWFNTQALPKHTFF